MKDVDLFQRTWPMGRVTAVYEGSNGLVRAVDVTNGKNTYSRPIHKLVKLLGHESNSSPREEYVQVTEYYLINSIYVFIIIALCPFIIISLYTLYACVDIDFRRFSSKSCHL